MKAARKPRTSDRRIVIATAGHVDHGKTTLVRALTGTDTDRLPDEKRRGISIELGFAELPGGSLSFIDVPGHHKLVHAMIAGVGGVDGVLLVVAADDAVMPQTREHLWVCTLLGIDRIVVALTKTDLVDEETIELAEADVRATLEAMQLEPQAIVRTSATTGVGIEALERELLALAAKVPPRADSTRVWLPIDRVFSIRGAGTVITGTLTRGAVAVGQRLWVASEVGMLETSCRSLEIHGRTVEQARAPTRIAVNLARVEVAEVHRGDVVTADGELSRSRRLDVAVRVLPKAERALKDRSAVTVHLGTTRATARFVRIAEGLAHLALDRPLPAEGGVGIVLRGFSSTREHGRVLAGGRVVDAAAPALPRRRDRSAWKLRAESLEAMRRGDFAAAAPLLLARAAPRAASAPDLERRFGVEAGSIARALQAAKEAVPVEAGTSWVAASALQDLTGELVRILEEFHRQHPHEPGASLETVRAALATRSGRELAELLLSRAASEGRVGVDQSIAYLPSFAARSSPGAQRAASRVSEALRNAGLQGATESDVAQQTGERPEVVRSTLQRLATQGLARRLSNLWFAEEVLDALRARVREHLGQKPAITVPEFKDLAGVSRKQAIPLLEQLDREGTTRRQGDLRVLGAAGKLQR